MWLRCFALRCKLKWDFGVKQLLFPEGWHCKKNCSTPKSHFSFHLSVKQRSHIVWFHRHLPYCHPPYQWVFVSYPGSHGGPVITNPCQCGAHHFGVCWLFHHYRYTILPNPLNGISGHLTGSGAQKRWKGVGGRELGSSTCDQEHCTHPTTTWLFKWLFRA